MNLKFPVGLCCFSFRSVRVGNMLFSVETQTTEERTQQYQSEIENIYKDLTVKGKALMLSTELGVRFTTKRFSLKIKQIQSPFYSQQEKVKRFSDMWMFNKHVLNLDGRRKRHTSSCFFFFRTQMQCATWSSLWFITSATSCLYPEDPGEFQSNALKSAFVEKQNVVSVIGWCFCRQCGGVFGGDGGTDGQWEGGHR